MKTALVTGSDGFIGSHLVEALVREGWAVRAFVFYNSFNSWGWLDTVPSDVKEEIDIFAGDIRDPFGVKEAMRGCNVIFHLAALIGIPYSYHSPQAYVETNISGTLNVLQGARELGTERVIQTSTSEVYGSARFVPMTEEHPLQGQSPYSATKIAADQLALSFNRSFGLNVGICRPFNTYGPRQSARAVIPTIVTQLLSGKRELELGSLWTTRDFSYVSDTVRGFIAMTSSDIAGKVINLGSNFEISIADTADLIGSLMGVRLTIRTKEERVRPENSEVERLFADNGRAKALLGWEPEHAGREGLKRGLEKTIAWFSEPSNRARYKANLYNV
jgi:dTDP-glucose 4,6-dehydratase